MKIYLNGHTVAVPVLPSREELLHKGKKSLCALLGVSDNVRSAIKTIRDKDPAATSDAEILLLYSGLHATLSYRVAHQLHRKGHGFAARLVSQGTKALTGIEIHPGASIGKDLFIDHGTGVVIGETTEIGDGCTIYQGVTLGGTGKDVGKRHPTLGNRVMVGAGAKVLGPVNIGDGAKIAAGAVVLQDIPAGATAVGIPARVVRKSGVKLDPLDQVHIPDPVSQELCRLSARLDELARRLDAEWSGKTESVNENKNETTEKEKKNETV